MYATIDSGNDRITFPHPLTELEEAFLSRLRPKLAPNLPSHYGHLLTVGHPASGPAPCCFALDLFYHFS